MKIIKETYMPWIGESARPLIENLHSAIARAFDRSIQVEFEQDGKRFLIDPEEIVYLCEQACEVKNDR